MNVIERTEERRTVIVREEYADALAAALLHGDGCAPAGQGGRGALARFRFEGGTGLIRTYRRGGVVRYFAKDTYVLCNRPLREFGLLEELFEAGLPVPEPLGVLWERTGPFSRGKIATREVDAITLCEYLCLGPQSGAGAGEPSKTNRLALSPFLLMQEVGRLFRQMHDLGVYHADLQVHNVLVGQDKLYLIDFDNAKRFPMLTTLQRMRNLLRFRRSLDKNGLPPALFSALCEGYGVDTFPSWLERAYAVKARISDVISRRTGRLTGPDIVVERIRGRTVYRRKEVALASVLAAMETPGETLKRSKKSETRRVGEWVVKASRTDTLLEPIKRMFWRRRYRQGWIASRSLEMQGVAVPRAIAFVERTLFGLAIGTCLISEYLEGVHTVEDHARALVARGADTEGIKAFLSALADAVNALCATGTYHTDLSGKNILTKDGATFLFIDLDGVVIGRPYTGKIRMKNHVQLYDSFCDLWNQETLDPFITRMLPSGYDPQTWLCHVHQGQAKRRARIETIWRMEKGR